MILRDYQVRAIEATRAAYRDGKRKIILCLPTGAGKTVVMAAMIQKSTCPVVFYVHRRELVKQAVARLAAWGIAAGVIAAGERASSARVQVASIPTVSARLKRGATVPPAGLVFVDECQHARAGTWQEIIEAYPLVIGASATPYRLDGRGLGELFDSLVNPVSVQDLCDAGVLVEPTVYAPSAPDLSGVRMRNGDFAPEALAQRMAELEGNIVEHWLALGERRRTVVFAVNIEHSRALTERFRAAGVRAEHLDGGAPAIERDAVLARLATGETEILSNCMLLGEGWDLPALSVAILARPTASMALHRQQIGRIMRSCDGKDGALVLDHAGNHLRHGFVTDPIDISLDGKVKRQGEASLKTCPACFCVMSASASACPECGHVFTVGDEREAVPEESDGRLTKLEKRTIMRDWYASLIADANRYGSRLGWARHKFKDRYGCWPSAGGGLGRAADEIEDWYRCAAYEPRTSQWRDYCGRCYRNHEAHNP